MCSVDVFASSWNYSEAIFCINGRSAKFWLNRTGEWKRKNGLGSRSGRVVNKLLVNEVKIFVNHKTRRPYTNYNCFFFLPECILKKKLMVGYICNRTSLISMKMQKITSLFDFMINGVGYG